MFLTYGDIKHLFIKTQGYRDDDLAFFTVTTEASDFQLKGLFVPAKNGANRLQRAISNGAIASIWDVHEEIPFYTPNDFPIFFTNDINRCFVNMMELYLNKLKDVGNGKMTHFICDNKNKQTMDVQEMKIKLAEMIQKVQR